MPGKTILRRLEADAARIANRQKRIAQMQMEQSQEAQEHAARVDQFVLETARAAGVTALPLPMIVAGLAALGNAGKSAGEGDDDQHEDEPVVPAGGSRPIVEPLQGSLVIVKVSRNVAEEKRDALKRAGLKWNGRAGHWRGSGGCRDGGATARRVRGSRGDRIPPPAGW